MTDERSSCSNLGKTISEVRDSEIVLLRLELEERCFHSKHRVNGSMDRTDHLVVSGLVLDR